MQFTKTSLTVTEANGGTGESYYVVLTSEPTASVSVTITEQDSAGETSNLLNLSPASLTFDADAWYIGQMVTVTADNDADVDSPDDPVTLIHAFSNGGYDAVENVEVEVTIKDDDKIDTADEDNDGDTTEIVIGTAPEAETRLTVNPSMVVFAEHEDDEDFAIPEFTVAYEPAGGTELSTDDTITVTINAPTGYQVDDPAAEAGDTDLQRRTAADETMDSGADTAVFTISYYGDELVIAPTQVDLQMRPDELDAMEDADTDGGRTKIDLAWKETYSHDSTPGVQEPDGRVYATEYRIQWSTNPDASEWELLDDVLRDVCNADHECTHSHTDLYAGEEYSYRIFAKNAAEAMGTTMVNNVVYSWSAEASDITTDAEKPGAPRNLKAERSQSEGQTEIELSWQPPIVDDDGVGYGDGFGVIVKYVLEQSADRSDSWEPLAIVTPAKACKAGGSRADHQLKTIGPVISCKYTHTGLMPGQTMRYRVATVNIGVPEKTSDWSDTATLTTEKSTSPDRPEGLVAEAMGRSMINLMWNIQSRTPPAAPIIAYIVEYLDDDVWMEAARITDADAADNQNGMVRTIHTDAGLPGETTRTYRVLAQNMPAVGEYEESAESERAMATTAEAVAPDAPTGVEAMTVSDTEITVTWGAPDDNGAAITSYMVERGVMGADSTMTWTAVEPAHTDTDTMYMDMGLMPRDHVLLPRQRHELGRHG